MIVYKLVVYFDYLIMQINRVIISELCLKYLKQSYSSISNWTLTKTLFVSVNICLHNKYQGLLLTGFNKLLAIIGTPQNFSSHPFLYPYLNPFTIRLDLHSFLSNWYYLEHFIEIT